MDEAAHYDYVISLSQGHVPAWGDFFRYDTLRLFGCLPPQEPPNEKKCVVTPQTLQAVGAMEGTPAPGYSYEAQQPPIGYLPYLLTIKPNAKPLEALDAARQGGEIWAALTAMLIVVYAAIDGLSLLQLASLLVISLLSTVALFTESVVSDESAWVFTGVVALIATRALTGRSLRVRAVTGLAVGLFIGMIDGLVLFLPLALLIAATMTDRVWSRPWAKWSSSWASIRTLMRTYATELSLLVGSVAALGGWQLFQSLRGSMSSYAVMNSFMHEEFAAHYQMVTVVTGIQQGLDLFGDYQTVFQVPWWSVVDLAVFGVIIAAAVLPAASSGLARVRPLAVGSLVAILAIAVFCPTLWFIRGNWNWYTPARYCLPFLPLIAVALTRMPSRWALLGVGVVVPLIGVAFQIAATGGHF
jgi:hypothetical protein